VKIVIMTNRLGGHAIVIGGSIAGMMGARVLADYFDQVTICERDPVTDSPALHKSVPQGNHIHTLLQGGQQVLSSLYPGFIDELGRMGAVDCRMGIDLAFYFPEGKAYNLTGSVREPRELGLVAHSQSRGLLEHVIRRFTMATPNIKFATGVTVRSLVNGDGRIRGVRYDDSSGGEIVSADLVLDAGGRGSRALKWLADLGFDAPLETRIGVDFAYSSAFYKRPANYHDEPMILVGGRPPAHPSGGGIFLIENDVWHVSLGGRFGDYPPTDEAGFLAFAQRLPSPRIYELIKDAERIGEITQHRFPTSIQRHYEAMSAFPEGFLIIGDAICSFNPVYGQGMTSAALQVRALQTSLRDRAAQGSGLEGLASVFFPKAAEVISAPWILAANFDFAFPQTTGQRPPAMEEGARYFVALDVLQVEHIEVQRLLTEVFQLLKPLSALWDEPIRNRVLARLQRVSG
jgi:2-polyprenyl-6-methoxyphenol hydroxylase-like FAD-dependent oxidoreductase